MKSRPQALLFGETVKRIHCLGVGGMGMAPLAIYMAQAGYEVSGQDDALSDEVRDVLLRNGVRLEPIPEDCDLVAISSAIKPDHPAMTAVTASKCRVVKRGELLAEVARGKKLVAICGSHGKTTTAAMLIDALRRLDSPADYVLGALFADESVAPAACTGSDWLVAEVDESDGTIDGFNPEISLIVNLDWDHTDHYATAEAMIGTFDSLVARTTGAVLTSKECELSEQLSSETNSSKERLTFGRGGDFAGQVDSMSVGIQKLNLGGRFELKSARVRAIGEFNTRNALGALATAQIMGATLCEETLASFIGVRRRQSVLSDEGGIRIIEDYAHHPNEVGSLLISLREALAEGGRLITVFQPHRFSRTAQFKHEFVTALSPADTVFLLEVYSAGESPVEGGTSTDLLAACRSAAPELAVRLVSENDDELFALLDDAAREGDTLVFVGAGSIDEAAHESTRRVKSKRWDAFVESVKPQLSDDTLIKREEPLANKTTMRVGGAARIYAEPASRDDLQLLVKAAQAEGVDVRFLGRGSNLIIADEGVDALVISLTKPQWAEFTVTGEGQVRVGAGLRLKNLCGLAAKAGLVGLEFLEGIPGNVGGALRMNAGAMGGWMFDIVEEVELMTHDGEIRTVPKADMHVAYRCCEELLDAIAIGAVLSPSSSADTESVGRQIDVYRKKRQESQPREPSAGCIFKNPEGGSAGQLIDEAGLKGERVGGAEVSLVHGNFVVNRDKASGSDVVNLVRKVRSEILHSKGIALEPEAQLWGQRWKDVL
jgi:UDP-N-acetylmuramate--alanine ligase